MTTNPRAAYLHKKKLYNRKYKKTHDKERREKTNEKKYENDESY